MALVNTFEQALTSLFARCYVVGETKGACNQSLIQGNLSLMLRQGN